jgi:16S rRNA A1518/A1519 N6-dimethyltransferase RsmA/KsgA/DIM1 with predicted DNA glycosylase/AP lyase activity
MNLLFQKEVGERICAPPSTRARSRLSILAQAVCNVSESFILPSKCFVPTPKVDVSVVKFKKGVNLLDGVDSMHFENVVRIVFGQRRKSIRNSLQTGYDKESAAGYLKAAGIDGGLRAADLAVEDFVRLAKIIAKKL